MDETLVYDDGREPHSSNIRKPHAMSPSMLRAARKSVAGLALAACCLQFSGLSVLAQGQASADAPVPETVTLSREERLIADHGAEGAGGGASLGGTVGAQLLGTVTATTAHQTWSDSLWGNMLLSMAYQRDEELQKLVRRAGHVNSLTMLSVASVSGLGLAQSIYSYNRIQPQSVDVTGAHHPGGHDHVHLPLESKVPATLGIIGGGVTIAALGARAVMNRHYSRRMTSRQVAIRKSVDTILDRLTSGEDHRNIEPELTQLVGPRAAGEFLALWRAVHP
jgi:hypothetical protein